MKSNSFLFIIVLISFIASTCKKDYQEKKIEFDVYRQASHSGGSDSSGHIKIAVISDIHYMNRSLLHDGAANGEPFLTAMMHRPLIEYSAPIFEKVLSELLREHPDVVLIAGNLSLDGQKISHEAVEQGLQQLRSAGINVYICPGRYDISNPKSAEYYFDKSVKVPTVTSSEFRSIYKDFGYDNTGTVIARDPNSLSYVAQPFPGLWILSIDAIKYAPVYALSGRILPGTLKWLLEELRQAKEQHVTVLGLMSHSLIEHLKDQNKARPNTVIDNWEATADALTNAGLQVVFTGTMHATDITMRQSGDRSLYDIETAALVNFPTPYRVIILKNKELDINTVPVSSIDATLPGNLSFVDYSYNAFSKMMDRFFSTNTMGVPPRLAETVAQLAKEAMIAHFIGDEKLSPLQLVKINTFAAASPDSTKRAVDLIMNFWTDLNTKDNKWHIKLNEQ